MIALMVQTKTKLIARLNRACNKTIYNSLPPVYLMEEPARRRNSKNKNISQK